MKSDIYLIEAKISVEIQEALDRLEWVQGYSSTESMFGMASHPNLQDIHTVLKWAFCLYGKDRNSDCF